MPTAPCLSPGCGWLPDDWLNQDGLRAALRTSAASRCGACALRPSLGYAPLRAHIAATLGSAASRSTRSGPADAGRHAGPGHRRAHAAASGRHDGGGAALLCQSVPDPAPGAGARRAGAARPGWTAGPGRVARLHRPRLLFVNTTLHNPTGTSLEAANAAEVLALAARHDFHIVEDDVSRELLDGWSPSLAGLDGAARDLPGRLLQEHRAVAAGRLHGGRRRAAASARSKMMSGLTGPETMERLVHHVLLEGRHATHTARLRDRLARAHEQIEALLDAHGFEICAAASRPVPVGATRRPLGRARRRRVGQDGGGRGHLADAGLAVRHRGGICPGYASTWRMRWIRRCGALREAGAAGAPTSRR